MYLPGQSKSLDAMSVSSRGHCTQLNVVPVGTPEILIIRKGIYTYVFMRLNMHAFLKGLKIIINY